MARVALPDSVRAVCAIFSNRPKFSGSKALIASLLAIALAGSGTAAATREERALCGQTTEITRQLAEISGLQLKKPVPCAFITRDEVNQFLKKRVKEIAKPEEIRAEELTLKKFGLVPQDFDLAKTTIELLTEQAAAFYDYNRKKLFLMDSNSGESQETVLAHELAHALADQHFNLDKFIKAGRKSDDGSNARLSVMEGQATWLMSEFLARKLGQSLLKSPEVAAVMSGLSEASGGEYPVFDNSPLYLRRSLIFPYTKGMLFQQVVLQKLGNNGFSEVFHHPPVSTQQIFHPDKYLDSVKPTEPAVPDPGLPRSYKSLIGGIMGELEHSILIEQFGSKELSGELAPKWRGSSFELREDKKAGRVVLLYSVEWESEDAARRYFDFYKSTLSRKWRNARFETESPDGATGIGDDGRFEIRRKGALVTSVEGMAP